MRGFRGYCTSAIHFNSDAKYCVEVDGDKIADGML